MKKRVIKKISVVLIMLAFVIGCGKKKESSLIVPIQTVNSIKAPKELKYEYPGIVTANKDTPIAFRVAGPIVKMDVQIGHFYKKNQIIASIDKRDYQTQVNYLKKEVKAAKNVYLASVAIAENASSQYERVEKLYKEKSISKKSYDQVLAGMKSSAAAELASLAQYEASLEGLKLAKNKLEDTDLKAPFDGYVNAKYFDVGSVVAPGTPIISMSSDKDSKIRINVAEKDLKKIKNIVRSEFLLNDNKYILDIDTIAKVKGFGKVSYPIVFKFEKSIDKDILIDSEGTVQLTFVNPRKNSILIPSSALFEKKGIIKVWIYKDGTIKTKDVSNVIPYDDGMVIVTGINADEKIVTKGVNSLSDNQKVKLLKEFSDTNTGKVL